LGKCDQQPEKREAGELVRHTSESVYHRRSGLPRQEGREKPGKCRFPGVFVLTFRCETGALGKLVRVPDADDPHRVIDHSVEEPIGWHRELAMRKVRELRNDMA
jgi:hypothetical protein